MPPTYPDLTDRDQWADDDLDQLRIAVLIEQERRHLLDTAEQRVEDVNQAYIRAIGRQDGDPWTQPSGAHDAHSKGAIVTHGGKTWESLIPNNVWEPGLSGWREKAADDPDTGEPGVAEYVQPSGGHDAYQIGDRVLWEGRVYESVISANVWSPAAHAAGWKLVD